MTETAKPDGIFSRLRTTGLELREKLNHESLHDAKVALIHRK